MIIAHILKYCELLCRADRAKKSHQKTVFFHVLSSLQYEGFIHVALIWYYSLISVIRYMAITQLTANAFQAVENDYVIYEVAKARTQPTIVAHHLLAISTSVMTVGELSYLEACRRHSVVPSRTTQQREYQPFRLGESCQ